MKYDVIIGLPARNEERGIYNALKSIVGAVAFLRGQKYAIIVCTNGCTDNTEKLVFDFIKKHPKANCYLIKSRPGLVEAQRQIVRQYSSDIFVFPDADGKIDKNAIKLLLEEFRKNSKLVVCYAKTLSLRENDRSNFSLPRKMGLLYASQRFLIPRKYFHGRLFATKDWYMPENKEILKRAHNNKSSSLLIKYCRNKIMLSADDVFMSSYIMNKYGTGAIKQVDKAHCYSWPVASFSDWFYVYRRRNIEMEKMKRWFPEFNYLWSYLNRRTNWSKWLSAGFVDKTVWLIFLLMKTIFFCYLRMEFLLLKVGFYDPQEQWHVATSTKKP